MNVSADRAALAPRTIAPAMHLLKCLFMAGSFTGSKPCLKSQSAIPRGETFAYISSISERCACPHILHCDPEVIGFGTTWTGETSDAGLILLFNCEGRGIRSFYDRAKNAHLIL
jgi:hypothetical protein